MPTRRTATVLLLALCLAGCANTADSGGGPQAAAPASAPSSVSSPDVVTDLPTVKPTGKPATGATRTITGQVSAGVEPGCLLLTDSTGAYLLFFDDPAMRSAAKVGAKVTVVGRPEPGMMTTCQQGTPFVVSAVRAN